MRVLVAGDLNVDLIIAGLPSIPELGTERVGDGCQLAAGGSATNMAACLAALGVDARLAARVGEDLFGRYLLEQMASCGVDTTHVKCVPGAGTGITVALACAADRAFATFSGAVRDLSPDDIPDEALAAADHLHVASIYLVPQLGEAAGELFLRARDAGCTTSLDTGFDPRELWDAPRVRTALEHCDYFLPNEVELAALSGMDDEAEAAMSLAKAGCTVVAKLGAEGALAVAPGVEALKVPAPRIVPRDTTGCGDTFNAALVKAVLSGEPLASALAFANAAGALCATRLGGSGVIGSEADVRGFMERQG